MLAFPQFMSEKKVLKTFYHYNLIVFLSIAEKYSVPMSIGVVRSKNKDQGMPLCDVLETYYGYCGFADNGMIDFQLIKEDIRDCISIYFYRSEIICIYLGECENLLADDMKGYNKSIKTSYFEMCFNSRGALADAAYSRGAHACLQEPIVKLIDYIQKQKEEEGSDE